MTDQQKNDLKDPNNRVFHALLWAAALIGSALLMKGGENADKMFILLLSLAAISTIAPKRALACERRLLQRLLK